MENLTGGTPPVRYLPCVVPCKLYFVDDEEIVCNTIAKVIPWEELGITLIGTCLDGVEAYHTILDESPDIVMTDIRMPGISGLELDRKSVV